MADKKTTALDAQLNEESMRSLLDQLGKITHKMQKPDHSTAQHLQEQGKIPVRARIDYLIDHDSGFLELSPLAGYKLYDTPTPAGGIITGIGKVSGYHCMIIANDPTVKGGSYFPITIKKHLRAQDIALANHLPCIYLVDSGGAFLPMQEDVFPDKEHFGKIFFNQAQLSQRGIPQVAVVLGMCTAGGAYVPAMADQTIMVKDQSSIYLGGPPLVKAATGERIDSETLGGAYTHCRNSGVADYFAQSTFEALDMARTCIKHSNTQQQMKIKNQISMPPQYTAESIYTLIERDSKVQMNVHAIIKKITDDSAFDEFKQLYGKTLICGFAHIDGMPVGIIANNGVLFSEAALKGTHFIELCCSRKIPLLFLQNITGFMVGKKSEHDGIAKHGAKMVMAVACANVPKITLLIGGSYGAGNYAMCGRAFAPDFLFSWPNARVGVMGGEQAATVLTQIKKAQMERRQQPMSEECLQAMADNIRNEYYTKSDPYYASARLWDDGIIDPKDTRKIVSLCLEISSARKTGEFRRGVYRM